MSDLSFSEPLSEDQTKALIDSFLDNNASDNIIRSYLEATSNRVIDYRELIGAVKSLRQHMLKLDLSLELQAKGILDTCGTGGSGLHTFNTSTAAAFVCAASSQPVAKHGNRAASSLCGSADVIEALGINLDLSIEQLARCLKQTNFCFMFAPKHHASTKRVAVIRRELGKRTIFNFLGPLCNPAQASFQVLGVSDYRMLEIVAKALPALGVKKALVVRGHDGLDEISLCAQTDVFEVKGSEIIKYVIAPEDFGFKRADLEEIKGQNAKDSAKILRAVLKGVHSSYSDLVALNAGAGLYVSKHAESLAQGIQLAKEILQKGKAEDVLNKVIEFSKNDKS